MRSLMKAWKEFLYQILASEISQITRFCTKFVQVGRLDFDQGCIYDLVACDSKSSIASSSSLKTNEEDVSTYFFNGNFNHSYDIQKELTSLKKIMHRHDRVVSVVYNSYFSWLYRLVKFLNIRNGDVPSTFITKIDLQNIAELSGFEIVRLRMSAYCPFKLFGIGPIINKIMPVIPVFRWLGLVSVVTLRPIISQAKKPSLSVVIPARNEKGNIENAITRLPKDFCEDLEVIFVEGNSTDDTWEEILRVKQKYAGEFNIKALQQSGKGKADAVRLGFSHSSKDLLTILDADLTMPPEMLPRFYQAYYSGKADFVNGSRLVYPMENDAMRFLNLLGNKFFARALSFVLDNQISDSLCGTKLMSRMDYNRFTNWREYFGDFDPFGDFELIFPASVLGLGTIDVPIRYRDRTYGETNISRFKHGLMLIKMTAIGLFRIKCGHV